MAEQKPLLTSDELETLSYCTEHPDKQTEFYCVDHNAILCSMCLLKSNDHTKCRKIIEMKSAGKSFLTSKFTDNVLDECADTSELIENTITEIIKANKYAGESLKVLRSEVESIRSKMLEAFDRQTNHILHAISADLLDNSDRCVQTIYTLRSIGKCVKEREALFKDAIEKEAASDVFRGVLSLHTQRDSLLKEIEHTQRNCTRQAVIFEKSELVSMLETDKNPLLLCNVENATLQLPNICQNHLDNDFKSRLALIQNDIVLNDKGKHNPSASSTETPFNKGRLSSTSMHDLGTSSSDAEIETPFSGASLFRKRQPYPNVEISYSDSFQVEMFDDEEPWFGGIVSLSDEKLILSDYKNKRLIMLENCKCVSETDIKFIPSCLTLFGDILVVCLTNTNQLLLMTIKGKLLKVFRYLQTRYYPKCVQVVDSDRILVSSRKGNSEWNLELLTLERQNWSTTKVNIKLSGLYDGYKLAVQHVENEDNGFRIIHCCEELNKIRCFQKVGGTALFEYDVEGLTALITDHFGNIFLSTYSGELQVLSPEGSFVTSIYRKVMKRMKFSAFNKSMDKLYITTNKNSKIHILDINRSNI